MVNIDHCDNVSWNYNLGALSAEAGWKDGDQIILYTTWGPQIAEFYDTKFVQCLNGELYGQPIKGVVLAWARLNKPEIRNA